MTGLEKNRWPKDVVVVVVVVVVVRTVSRLVSFLLY